MAKHALTNEQIAEALQKAGGFVSHAAKQLGVVNSAIHNRIARSPELKAILDDARCTHLDLAEVELLKAMKRGEAWAVCFFLKCQGKGRGYIERQAVEHTGKDGGPIQYETMTDKQLESRLADLLRKAGIDANS